MNHPNTFLIQRKALARFRKIIPFLTLIPPAIYQRLSPLAWYEPFGEIAQAWRELEEALGCYIMLCKRYGPETPWETQLFVYIHEARLSPKQQAILNESNEFFWTLGIECQVYQKPLRIRSEPLEHPFTHCDPPYDDEPALPDGVDPDDIPF